MVAGKILSFQIDVRGESEGSKRIAELDQSLAKLNATRRESLKESKKSDTEAKKRVKTISQLNAKITEGKRERQKLIAEEKRLTKAYQSGDGSVTKLRLKMQTLKATMEKLNLTTKTGQREFKRLNAQYQRGTGVLRKYDQRLSGSTRLQGAFTKGITNSFKSIGAGLIGIAALIRVFRDVVKIIGDFDKATAKLASVTGKTREEISDLTDQSKELGAVTQFTANQVAELQIELAKLGFTANEISLATPGILSFATATGANLAAAAKTAGAAVRIFGLNASETEDAVATLAVATTKSGLTFEHFDTILSTVGPVAKAYGFTLADVVALTGELATKGFEANKAATATRNILLNLADVNGELAKKLGGTATTFDGLIDGLIRADKEGISLAETLELTDKRSVAAFSTFLEGAESARELRDGIVGVNKELQEMVDKQLDTLAGDIDLLRSAWQGFVLNAEVGPFRKIVQLLTNAALQISNVDLAVRKFNKQTDEQLERSFTLLQSLTNKQGKAFQAVLDAYTDANVQQLKENRQAIIFYFSEVRKVNKKEAAALFEELLRQRQATADQEFQALLDQQARISAEEEKAAKLKLKTETEAAQERIDKLNDVSKLVKQLAEDEKEALIEDNQEAVIEISNAWDLIAESTEGAFEGLESLISNQFDIEMETLQKKTEEYDKYYREREAAENMLKDIEIAAANEAFNIVNSLFSRKQAKLDQQLKNELISEEKFEEEKLKLRRKVAIVDKAQAVFNIALNTAIGVTSAASKVATIPLIPFIIGLGALQAVAVLAEPLPSFYKGGVVDYESGGKVKGGYEMPWSTPQGDNTLALVKPREVILNESQQAALGGNDTFRRIGVPGFAAGGAIGAPVPAGSSIDLLTFASAFADAINDKKVILDVNELNAAEADLELINTTNEL